MNSATTLGLGLFHMDDLIQRFLCCLIMVFLIIILSGLILVISAMAGAE